MEGRADGGSTGAVRAAVAALREKGVVGTILGCTELPLLLGEEAQAPDLINQAELLASETVRYVLGEEI
jgi:aspartate/glutamate racemase